MNPTIQLLKSKNIKVTTQRIAIYDILSSKKAHHTVEMIYDELVLIHPTVSLATIYKTLQTFEQEGLVQTFSVDNNSARYDLNIQNHPHAICKNCGSIFDVPYSNSYNSVKNEIEKTGFTVTSYQSFFYGLCSECQK